MKERAESSWEGVPMRTPSSKYQELHGRCSERWVATGYRAQEKKRGPRGSPCWTPEDEGRIRPPQYKEEGVPYMEEAQASASGQKWWTELRTADRLTELNALV